MYIACSDNIYNFYFWTFLKGILTKNLFSSEMTHFELIQSALTSPVGTKMMTNLLSQMYKTLPVQAKTCDITFLISKRLYRIFTSKYL